MSWNFEALPYGLYSHGCVCVVYGNKLYNKTSTTFPEKRPAFSSCSTALNRLHCICFDCTKSRSYSTVISISGSINLELFEVDWLDGS